MRAQQDYFAESEPSLLFKFGASLSSMRRRIYACHLGLGSLFRPLPFRLSLLAACILLAITVAAQSNLATLLGQARVAEKSGDYGGAARIYEQALAMAPGDLEVLKRFGVLEQTELNFDDSIAHLTQVLARNPKYPEANFYLGVSYFGKNDLRDAIESFHNELATPKPHPRCRYYLALALQSSGRIDDAVAELNRTLADNPKDADALYQLARLHKNASLEAIERLRALDPDSSQLHVLMGESYAEEKRYPDAIEEYQSALKRNPSAVGIHFSIGVAYWVLHEPEKAEPELKEALKENPEDPMTNLYLGDIAVQDQRFDEAFKYLQTAEKAHMDVPQMHTLLGRCYQERHDPESAKRELLVAIKGDPTAAAPHYLLAQVYRELHDTDASARELSQFDNLSKLATEKAQAARGAIAPESK
jgi:tetratricopeptide (TPR) repeat protein